MYLSRIKSEAERKGINFRKIASLIGMSEQNLHRCVRQNKIQADDLKSIADILGVKIDFFFDDEVIIKEEVKHYGDGGAHAIKISKVDARVLNKENSNPQKQKNSDPELEEIKKELKLTKDKLLEAQSELISMQRTAWNLQLENEKLKIKCKNQAQL